MALDIASAVHYNRTQAAAVGWASRQREVADFLQRALVPVRPHGTPGDTDFAELVAFWQDGENRPARRAVLEVDGKLGPASWLAMQPHLAREVAGRTLKTLDVHVATLDPPRFDYNAALRFARDLYGSIGIRLRVRTEICPSRGAADPTRRTAVDDRRDGEPPRGEPDDPCARAGATAAVPGVRIFLVGRRSRPDTARLRGDPGHAPGKPACVIDGNRATIFTLSHELGHILLAPDDRPTHPTSTSNAMYRVTHGHPLSSPPGFDAAQIARIRANALLR